MPLGQMRLRLHFESLDLRGSMTGGPARTHMFITWIHQFGIKLFFFCRAWCDISLYQVFFFYLYLFLFSSSIFFSIEHM